MKSERKINAIIYILLVALVLRLFAVTESFWLDEATSGLTVRNYSLLQIITVFIKNDFHPPLYYLVIKIWSYLFGSGELALRSVSILFGLGNIWVIYKIGSEIKDGTLGKLSAILLASSPLHIYYSVEARMYMMASFLVSYLVLLVIRFAKVKKLNRKDSVLLGLSLLAIFLTDYLSALIVFVFLCYWYGEDLRVNINKFGIALSIFAVGCFMWMPVFLQQLGNGLGVKTHANNWWKILGEASFKNILLIPVKFVIGRVGFSDPVSYVFIVGFTLGFFGYLLMLSLMSRAKTKNLIYCWLVLPILLGLMLSLFVPVLTYFRFLFVLPAMYLLIGMGLMQTDSRKFLPMLMAVLMINVGFLVYYFQNPRFHRENWKGFVNDVNTRAKENSRIVFVANSQMEGFKYYDSQKPLYFGEEGVSEKLDEIWLMRYVWNVFDSGDLVRKKVEENYELKESLNYNGVIVYRYENRN